MVYPWNSLRVGPQLSCGHGPCAPSGCDKILRSLRSILPISGGKESHSKAARQRDPRLTSRKVYRPDPGGSRASVRVRRNAANQDAHISTPRLGLRRSSCRRTVTNVTPDSASTVAVISGRNSPRQAKRAARAKPLGMTTPVNGRVRSSRVLRRAEQVPDVGGPEVNRRTNGGGDSVEHLRPAQGC